MTEIRKHISRHTKTDWKGRDYFVSLKNVRDFDLIVKELHHLNSVRELIIGHQNVDDEVASAVMAHSTTLKKLRLDSCTFTAGALDWLGKCELLEDLVIDRTPLPLSVNFDSLRHLRQLENLSIIHSHMVDEQIPELSTLKGLKHINLSGNRLTHYGVAKTCHGIKSLDCSLNMISDSIVPHIIQHSKNQIEEITLYKTWVTENGLSLLRQCPNLRKVDISGMPFSEVNLPGVKIITNSLEINHEIS